ncbi:MAG: prolipoprotein diacylglyceryl transferase [Deltaproteobacteria bacterium]|nr:prolipoprotein diacylglyceryl transferase [Deltaproteobacteria bacterium]
MVPELFELFGISFPAYFVLLTTGFGLAIWMSRRWGQRTGLDKESTTDLGLYMLIAGVAGARILHVLVDGYFWDYVHLCTDPAQVTWEISRARCLSEDVGGIWDAAAGVCHPGSRDCLAWAKFWNGGLTYYGGFLAATWYGIRFIRKEKLPLLKTVDMAGFTIPFGLIFGRLGCFLGGCCYGKRTDAPWAVSFPGWSAASEAQHKAGLLSRASMPSLPVHPTQIYESVACLAIFTFVYFYVWPRKRYDGQVFVAFVALYAVARFLIEYWRDDDRGGLWSLSTSQIISALLLAAAIVLGRRLAARARAALASPGN